MVGCFFHNFLFHFNISVYFCMAVYIDLDFISYQQSMNNEEMNLTYRRIPCFITNL